RLDDAAAEVMLPDPVDHHARGQRLVRARDPTRQGVAEAARRELAVAVRVELGRFHVAGDRAWEAWLDGFARLAIIAARQHVDGLGRRAAGRARGVADGEDDGLPAREAAAEDVELASELGVAVDLLLRERLLGGVLRV